MKIKELQKKSKKELKYLLEDSRKKLTDLRFKIFSKQLKNVRESFENPVRAVYNFIIYIKQLIDGWL